VLIRIAGALAMSAAMAAGAANAQEWVNPSWASMPDTEAMSEAYPAFAYMAGLEGDVSLRCNLAGDGVLSLCRATGARPAGLGFDRAGLSVSSLFRASPAQRDGETIPSRVEFTVRFRMPEAEAPLPWTGPEPTAERLAAALAFVQRMEAWKERGDERFETMNLDVDADREARVRAIVLGVKAEFVEREVAAGALATARLLTPEQMADVEAGRGYPAEPPEDTMIRAADQWELMGLESERRLKQAYCAEFDCPDLATGPVAEGPSPAPDPA
jgi:hypothetical protein